MKPVEFEGANTVLRGGPGSEFANTPVDVADLPIWSEGNHTISCWSLSFTERLRLLVTGRVWLHALAPTHPPIKPDTLNPFPAHLLRAIRHMKERGTKQRHVEEFWQRVHRIWRM